MLEQRRSRQGLSARIRRSLVTRLGIGFCAAVLAPARAGAQGFASPTSVAPPIDSCTDIEDGRFGSSLASADLDGDGFSDLVIAPGYVAYSKGDGGFLAPVLVTDATAVTAADVNGDDFADAVFLRLGGRVEVF